MPTAKPGRGGGTVSEELELRRGRPKNVAVCDRISRGRPYQKKDGYGRGHNGIKRTVAWTTHLARKGNHDVGGVLSNFQFVPIGAERKK